MFCGQIFSILKAKLLVVVIYHYSAALAWSTVTHTFNFCFRLAQASEQSKTYT
jgi:hypothetical protein